MAQPLVTIAFRTVAAIAAVVAIYVALAFAFHWTFFRAARPLQPLFTVRLMDALPLDEVKVRAVRSGYNATSGENVGGRYLNVTGEGCYVSIYTGADSATHIDVDRFSDLPNGSCEPRSARKMVATLIKA